MEIIPDNEESLDELIVRARTDSKLKAILQGERKDKDDAPILAAACGRYCYFIHPDEQLQKYEKPAEGIILDMAVYDHNLVYALPHRSHQVRNFFTNEDVVSDDGMLINAICATDHNLFYAGEQNGEYKIKDLKQEYPVITRDKDITAMCINKSSVFDSADCIVSKTHSNISGVTAHQANIHAICWYRKAIIYSAENKVYHIVDDKSPIAERPDDVLSVCVHDGVLYDSGKYGIYETLANKKATDEISPHVLCSVPVSVFAAAYMRKIKGKWR
jgi:hypothetical protein